ncbi:MAG TPA: aldo/keto reductase [Chloroflexia bacterium]|nr:aldo/keto reductase [Chloroflexia bacterium]
MEYRELGQTGIRVSAIGFGAWAIGGDAWGAVADDTSLAAINQALELGITFLDTADVYGDGRSEQLVGQAVQGRRDGVVISTKGGLLGHHRDPHGPPVYDRPEKVIAALDASLQRLGTDYVDVYFCHIWWDKPEETAAFQEAFAQMKQTGKARAVGVSTDNFAYLRHFNEAGAIDAVQLDYSILNRRAEQELLPYAAEQRLGVVVRGPLQKGLLTGIFSSASAFPEGDIRHDWPEQDWYRQQLAAVTRLHALTEHESLGRLALRYVLSHPAVSVAIPGAKTPEQVTENAAAGKQPLLSPEQRQQIDKLAPVPE